jgi:putative membrane protein
MKKRLRNALFASLAFLLLAYIYPGFAFDDSQTIILATAVFAFIYLFIRPVLKLLSLPLNLVTFGLFSFLVNLAILFLIAYLIPGFEIVAYEFEGFHLLGIQIPSLDLNVFLSALVASVALSFISSVVFWIFS